MKKVLNTLLGTKMVKKLCRLSCIMLSKMSAYGRDFDETKCISFLIKKNELLDKYNEVWDKVNKVIKRNLIVSLCKMRNI